MGKPAGRLGDIGSNHEAWHPSPITSGSGDVITNGKPAARVGDTVEQHTRPGSSPHGRAIAAGASNVFINGKPAARVGDAIDCGGVVETGSGNVFIGDDFTLNPPSDASLPDITFDKQTGKQGQYTAINENIENVNIKGDVLVDELVPETTVPEEPELNDAIVRIFIDPNNEVFAQDKFILESTDGSISITKTVKDDQKPGDNYLDLKYEKLDTSKNYTLKQIEGDSGQEYTYFENYNYYALDAHNPASKEYDDQAES